MRYAASLLVLGVLLLVLAYLLLPHWDSSRPLVSLLLVVTGPGGFLSALAGFARLLNPPPRPQTT